VLFSPGLAFPSHRQVRAEILPDTGTKTRCFEVSNSIGRWRAIHRPTRRRLCGYFKHHDTLSPTAGPRSKRLVDGESDTLRLKLRGLDIAHLLALPGDGPP